MVLALENHDWIRKTCIVDMAPVSQPSKSTSLFVHYVRAMKQMTEHGPIASKKEADEMLSRSIPELSIRQFLLTNLKPGPFGYHWRINLPVLEDSLSDLWSFPYEPNGFRTHNRPVLFIAGGKSHYITSSMWPTITNFFPQASLATLDAGHWVHAEKPADFIETTFQFFN